MDIRVLGPLEIVGDDGRLVRVGALKARMLLSVLVLAEGRPLSAATLVDRLWGEDAPAEAMASLHSYVSNLRRILEPRRPARGQSRLLTFGPVGYTLALDPQQVDANRFLQLIGQAAQAGEPAQAERAADEALRLWRGEPYADLAEHEYATAVRAHLGEARERARELRVAAIIRQDRHDEVLGELEGLTHEHPLRERLWALRALALYQSGRQAEALDALRTVRRILAEELGIDPGEELRDLERDILAQSPRLRPVRTTAVQVATGTAAETTEQGQDGDRAGTREESADRGGGRAKHGGVTERAIAGRREELAALEALLEATAAGTPGFALITGEPGIGKTRLAEEVAGRALAHGYLVTVGRCAAIEGAPAFWPWVTVLERLTDALPPLPAEVRANLPGVGSVTHADPEGARFRTYAAAARALRIAADARPVLVVLDDLHWADPSSLRLLSYLAGNVTDGALAVVGTARDWPEPGGALADAFEALARRQALRLPLAGLSADELAELTPAGTDVRALRDRTDGNPFFVTELVRYLSAGSTGRGALPLGVRDVVLGRVSRLPGPAADLLRVAAVAGREFDLAVVAEAAGLGLDEALDRLEPAMTAALVGEGRPGRFRFVHALVQEALTEVVPALRRARVHAVVARALEARTGGPVSDRLAAAAHHWLLAVPAGHAAHAWRAAWRAAEEAKRLRAYDVAADLLERAEHAADGDPGLTPAQRMDLLFALAEARLGAGDAQGQLVELRRVRELAKQAGDRRRWAAAATGYGGRILQPWKVYGDYDADLVADLLHLAADEALERAARARVLACLAVQTYHGPGRDPGEGERRSAEAVRLAREENDATLLGWVLFARYTALLDPDTVHQRLEASLEMAHVGRAAGDDELLAIGLTCQGGTLLELCRVREGLAVLAEAEALIERSHLPYLRIMLGWLRLGIVVNSGDMAAAEALLAATAAEHHATSMWGVRPLTAGGTHQVTLMYARRGTANPALPANPDTIANERLDYISKEGHACRLAVVGRLQEARQVIGPWEHQPPIPDTFVKLYWLVLRIEIWARLGDRQACADLYAQALPYADRMAMAGLSLLMWPVSRSLALLARVLGDPDAALRHAEHALRVAREMGADPLVELVTAETAGVQPHR
ncbi:BTAD domain-containing putative transcriptional regulator [Streptosporangium fragile]|uniref:BTAD domain-containing putative transcriptional regulator n=1 Tax=Streptosporangium fragile TaxID=46186 RepID=A0ABN3W6Z0_9ACTN